LVGRDVVHEDEPQGQATEEVEPQIARSRIVPAVRHSHVFHGLPTRKCLLRPRQQFSTAGGSRRTRAGVAFLQPGAVIAKDGGVAAGFEKPDGESAAAGCRAVVEWNPRLRAAALNL